jgi:hypothetical protein
VLEEALEASDGVEEGNKKKRAAQKEERRTAERVLHIVVLRWLHMHIYIHTYI